jgi:hypothetical protein
LRYPRCSVGPGGESDCEAGALFEAGDRHRSDVVESRRPVAPTSVDCGERPHLQYRRNVAQEGHHERNPESHDEQEGFEWVGFESGRRRGTDLLAETCFGQPPVLPRRSQAAVLVQEQAEAQSHLQRNN